MNERRTTTQRCGSELSRREVLKYAGVGAGVATLAKTGIRTVSAQESVTLKIAYVADQKDLVEELNKTFEEANPNIEVDGSYAPTEQLQSTLRTQLASGTAPDIFGVWPGGGNVMALDVIAPSGYLADLSGEPWASQVPGGLKGVTQVDGKQLMLPLIQLPIGVFYNKKVFADIEIDTAAPPAGTPTPGGQLPTTWAKFLALCDTVKAADKIPLALGLQTDWVTQLITYALVPSIVYSSDPKFDAEMQAGTVTFAGSGWKEALEKYMDLNQRGYFNDNPNGTTVDETYDLLGSGDAAMLVQVGAILPNLVSAGEPGNFDMFALPGSDDPEKVWIPAAAGVGWGVNVKSENLDAAKKYVQFWAGQDAQNAFAKASGVLPAVSGAEPEIPPEMQRMTAYIAAGRAVPFMDQLWPNADVQQAHLKGIQQLFAGETTIDELLAKMDEAYKKGPSS